MNAKNAITMVIIMLSSMMMAQEKNGKNHLKEQQIMKTYLIEREIPNASKLTSDELKGISQKSCVVLKELNTKNIQWLHSYVTENKVYCVYKATSKELIRKHAEMGGFPANVITEMATQIGPDTATN